ncbi:MAG TPA: diaminopimelate decarboxylase [Miltoncostaeaceae bacterium]|nr:diaminopimelate decarboxylase [Miltoncostaeaceae bacterium]
MLALEQVLPPSASVSPEGHLTVGGCDLVDLAAAHGTPLVVYDEGLLRATARAFVDAVAAHAPGGEVVYASKAYFGLAMLRLAAEEGLSVDVASGGELYAALRAGVPPERIHLHGNNKDAAEVAAALEAGVGMVIVDNLDEVALLQREAAARGVVQPVLVRVTPGIDPDTHRSIATGQVDSKFGFPLAGGLAAQGVEAVRAAPALRLVGLHAHLGSQLLDLSVFPEAAEVLAAFAADVGAEDLGVMDMGGGLGIAYTRAQRPPGVERFVETVAEAVREAWSRRGLPVPRLVIEPGRAMVGRAGMTLYRVGAVKAIPGVRTYAAVDGGMSDQLRPMLYGAVYEPVLANRADADAGETYRLVGKHCESGDVLVPEAHLPALRVGDLVCLPATGAYGVSMASNYNGQPRPAVVFVDDGVARVVTRRETYADIVARDDV